MRTRMVFLWVTALCGQGLVAGADDFVPPPDSGLINVKTDCGAKGDGVTDDTAALKSVLQAGKGKPHPTFGSAREIYLPAGTYIVSEPIVWGDKKKFVRGQSREKTVIKLKDSSPGFQDPETPLWLLDTRGSQHFAQNFFQRVLDLTIDVGSGNTESYDHGPNIMNDGGMLWILGIKTEKDRTIIGTTNGGWTEVMGGLLYKNRQRIGQAPAFINDGSNVSLSYRVTGRDYDVHVMETRRGKTRELKNSETGRAIPLYVGYSRRP